MTPYAFGSRVERLMLTGKRIVVAGKCNPADESCVCEVENIWPLEEPGLAFQVSHPLAGGDQAKPNLGS